ncbi:MAG: DUF4919 domain-containing protein [Deltaproteobacteria bacterium]|nr:DUF4919 domain-containing protein [Kofleriaceae bacterium]
MRRAFVLATLALACRPTTGPAPTPVAPAPDEPPPGEPPPGEPTTTTPALLSEPELSARKLRVNQLYDQLDFEGAIAAAEEILVQLPDDLRMLRVVTSAHCVLGNEDAARVYWARLPELDRRQIATRCARYDITFP